MKAHIPRVDFVILKTIHNKLMNYKNVIKEFFGKERIFLDQRKSLIVLLGSFADLIVLNTLNNYQLNQIG